jgi:hypothetical protein
MRSATRWAASAVGFWILLPALAFAQDLGASSAKTFETLTYSLENPTFSGNPYDIDATVLFTHADSGDQIRTGIYYDGGPNWRFRFTGTQEGTWTFISESDDDLSGATGSIDVTVDPAARGFLTAHGTKYGRQIGTARTVKAQPYVVYMNRRAESSTVNPGFGGDTDNVATWGGPDNAARRTAYIEQAQANGCNAIFLHVNNQWFRNGAQGWDDHGSTNPDRHVFAAIEDLIVDAHAAGLQVNIWAWGDNAGHRRWTPIGVPGGINGYADRRIQRYIADRLGPLPGWSMGYGFDLFEWTNQDQVSDWANFLTDRMGWDHLLSGRSLPLLGPDGTDDSAPASFVNGYASLRRGGQILQTDSNAVSRADDGGPDSYAETREDVLRDPSRPILYEERHAYQRYWEGSSTAWPTTSMDGTRTLLWWWTMAGGAGGWIGFYGNTSSASGDGPYPHPEQLRTHATFWEHRLELDMVVDNRLTGGVSQRQYALHSPDTGRIVMFAEDTNSIELNLDGFPDRFQATLVDAEDAYREIDLGVIEPTVEDIDLSDFGAARDWALSLTPVPESGTAELAIAACIASLLVRRRKSVDRLLSKKRERTQHSQTSYRPGLTHQGARE